MGELEAVGTGGASPSPRSEQHCGYCGSPLHPRLYFCLGCGTPYRALEEVLPPNRPVRLTDAQLIDRKAPQVRTVFWTFFSAVLLVGLVNFALTNGSRPDVSMLFGTAVIFITTCIVGSIYWRSLAVQLKRFGFFQVEAWLAVAGLVPVLAINYLAILFLTEGLGVEVSEPWSELRAMGFGETGLILAFCLLPAVTEELAFRGLVQHWLQAAIKPTRALVLASFLFAVMHFSILSLPYLFLVGLLLGWARLRTGSLYPSMLIHFLHNLVVIELFAM